MTELATITIRDVGQVVLKGSAEEISRRLGQSQAIGRQLEVFETDESLPVYVNPASVSFVVPGRATADPPDPPDPHTRQFAVKFVADA